MRFVLFSNQFILSLPMYLSFSLYRKIKKNTIPHCKLLKFSIIQRVFNNSFSNRWKTWRCKAIYSMNQRISTNLTIPTGFPRFFHNDKTNRFPPCVETVEKLYISFVYRISDQCRRMEKWRVIILVFHFSTESYIPHPIFPHVFHMESCGKWRNSFIYPVFRMFSCG